MNKEKVPSTSKRVWILSIIIWVALTVIISGIAPGAKEFTQTNKDGGLPADAESIIADRQLEEYFPQDGGLPLFAVFHKEDGLTEDEVVTLAETIEKLEESKELEGVEVLPLSKFQPEQRAAFWSEDKQTFFGHVTLPQDLEGDELHEFVVSIKETVEKEIDGSIEASWTGPAAIASDASELFSRADVVLLLSTIGLLLVLLLIIYRSPLLALIPLVGAAIVYGVVDRIIGITASAEWFTVESQALSIMTILLFAVITDYSLLIFSRYREELKQNESPSVAMKKTMRYVREPIFFSGSTIVLGLFTLFFTLYEPYRNFAPVFVIAAAVMLIAGLTLLPALFALIGRKAFWPFIPKYGEKVIEKKTIWGRIAKVVTKKPVWFIIPTTLLLLLGTWNVTNMNNSFDLIESFPEDLSSRVGYEHLGKSFSQGSLAPGTLLVTSEEEIEMDELNFIIDKMESKAGIESVSPQGHPLTEDLKNAKLSITFAGNPYDELALDTVIELREDSKEMLEDAGITDGEMFIVGESAKNADLRDINQRDTWFVMIMMSLLIVIMLGLQTRSVIAPIYMVGSILLSYAATLGLSIFLFKQFLGLEGISYRIPMYSFVFLVALGVDYSIMLIARIREEMKQMSFDAAVRRGLEKTGGVISSAGLILAATFLVLTTMPIYELKLFGFIMALGILIDTFIVRPLVIPSILILLGKWSFWPLKVKKQDE